MTRSAISPRLATSTFLNMPHSSLDAPRNPASWYPRLPPRAPPSGPRGCYGRGGGGRHECGDGHLYQVEEHEGSNTLRQGRGDGQARHQGKPGGAEGVDEGKTCASPEQARPQRPPAGGASRGVRGESRYGCGDRVGEQVPSRGAEQHAEPTP